MARKVLIVEDESNIAELINLYLKKEGYETMVAGDGGKALELYRLFRPDLVLLDIMLPVMDGWAVCAKIRETSKVPIIMLTAKGEVNDRITGLEMGADDYIVKPFDVAELLARVETVLRRFHKTEETLSLAGVRVDPRARKVWRGEEEVSLTPKEYDLLLLFLHNPSTGTPFMNGSGAENWPTAAKPWTCTSSVCGKKWAGKRRCRL